MYKKQHAKAKIFLSSTRDRRRRFFYRNSNAVRRLSSVASFASVFYGQNAARDTFKLSMPISLDVILSWYSLFNCEKFCGKKKFWVKNHIKNQDHCREKMLPLIVCRRQRVKIIVDEIRYHYYSAGGTK